MCEVETDKSTVGFEVTEGFILGKKFDEKLIIHFTDFLILKDFRKNKMSQDDLSDILLRNAFFLDFFSLRGKFFEETN